MPQGKYPDSTLDTCPTCGRKKPGRSSTPAIDRIMRRIEKTDGCWLWPGGTNGRGYGVIGAGSTRSDQRQTYVHRVVYEHHNGPIPDGLEIRHLCGTRLCVRPDHLTIGTRTENMADQIPHQTRRQGGTYKHSKLTEEQALAIKRRSRAGESATALAREFHISDAVVSQIRRGVKWTYLPD